MAPYAPGVVDRLMAWIDRLPGPACALHAVLLVVSSVFVNAVMRKLLVILNAMIKTNQAWQPQPTTV
jgi:hypothetical protein